jgi:hypothetical protein
MLKPDARAGLVVDGHEIHGDVLVTPGGLQEHWWRREGHVLRPEDLGALQDADSLLSPRT